MSRIISNLNLPEPIINYSPSLDFYLSIVQTSEIDIRPWIFENFIDVVYRCDEKMYSCEFLDMMHHTWMNTPFLDCSLLDRGFIESQQLDVVDLIKSLIDNKYYILLMVNTFYVSPYVTYKQQSLFHELLVHGYTDRGFLCSDYFDLQTRKDNVEILFDELRLGYEKVERSRDYYKGLMVAKVCHSVYEGQSYDKVNVFYLCEKIRHFLSDSLVQIHIPGFYHTKYGFRCGFSAFDELEKKIEQCESANALIKPLHLFEQHEKLMLLRLTYLRENQGFRNLDEEIDKLKFLNKCTKGLKVKMLFFDRRKVEPYTNDFANTFTKIKKEYNNTLQSIVTDLEKYKEVNETATKLT